MRKNILIIILIFSFSITLNSCFHIHDHDISVQIDDDDTYKMKAYYDEDQSGEVLQVINHHLHQRLDQYVDANLTLNDGTNLYIRSRPGRLKIKFNRSENTEENSEKLEQMCDEIKDILAREDNDN